MQLSNRSWRIDLIKKRSKYSMPDPVRRNRAIFHPSRVFHLLSISSRIEVITLKNVRAT